MSSRGICTQANCHQRRFADHDQCLAHLADPVGVSAEYCALIGREPVLRNLVVPLIVLDGVDFSHKTLIDCDFHGAVFNQCTFNETNMTFSLFDHAAFNQCRFHETKIIESVFGSGRLIQTEFSVADIIQCNFNGCRTEDSRFMACDLMYTRFLSLSGNGLLFEDCNLKGCHFSAPCPDWMSFTYSNKEDAFFL